MKRILFNDKFGLTQAVLQGRKTMTRMVDKYEPVLSISKFKIGEVVAVAQRYCDIEEYSPESYEDVMLSNGVICEAQHPYSKLKRSAGWDNKMFVKAELMPHQIRITDIRIERLQDISDEDCLKEGIIEDFKGVQYAFPTNVGYCGQYPFDTAKEAFAALIDKISGKGTWERNPYVFVYSFELMK